MNQEFQKTCIVPIFSTDMLKQGERAGNKNTKSIPAKMFNFAKVYRTGVGFEIQVIFVF